MVSQELLREHIDREATRAMERIMRSKVPNTINPDQLPTGTQVFVYYKSWKQNETNEWIPETVIKAGKHIIKSRRKTKGPPMTVRYNDVRIKPNGELTKELMQYELYDQTPSIREDEESNPMNTPIESIRANSVEDMLDATTANTETHELTNFADNPAGYGEQVSSEDGLAERIGAMNAMMMNINRDESIDDRANPKNDIDETTIQLDDANGGIKSDEQNTTGTAWNSRKHTINAQ